MSFVRWFRDIGRGDRASVGGKGASLGELAGAGLRVPDGFVVTIDAFEQFMAATDPAGEIRAAIAALDPSDLAAVARRTADIRARIETAGMPDDLSRELAQAYGELCAGEAGLPVAVRSSATAEDSEDASFAGMQETFLWVKGLDEMAAMTRACWASLYSDTSVLYRLRLNLPEEEVAMGVVVQRMVDARSAGVMFTRSPTTGDRSVVAINASWGLGSSVVSGEVTPDEYVVSKVTGELVKRTISTKVLRHVPRPGGGVREEQIGEAEQRLPCLDDAALRALVELGKRTERHYGAPQDIEWAIARDGAVPDNIYMLQSRPETVWAPREKEPLVTPKSNPFDHVLGALTSGLGTRKG